MMFRVDKLFDGTYEVCPTAVRPHDGVEDTVITSLTEAQALTVATELNTVVRKGWDICGSVFKPSGGLY
jgi:hypothetical protein